MSSTSSPPADAGTLPTPHHDERLAVPAMWWVVSLFLAMTFVVAVWAILSDVWALGALVVFFGLVVIFLIGYGSARITADGTGLRAGRASIDWEWVRGATALDGEQTQLALKAAADGRTWLLVRPFLKSAVRVDLADPADPHRHWLLATRQPGNLAAAILAHSAAAPTTRRGSQ